MGDDLSSSGIAMELTLMTCFIVKHFICDFPGCIQTPWMFMNKGTYGHPGGIAHALIHAFVSALLLIIFSLSFVPGEELKPTHALVFLVIFEFLVHYHMDWFKMWWCERKQYTPHTFQFWNWLGIDQMVHYLTYILMVGAWLS